METDAFDYAINRGWNQLTPDDLGQWHLVAYYLHKMILVITCYKTHNDELLPIIKVFKTW